MSSLLVCFAGGFLIAPLCGEPILDAIGDPLRLAIFTILWYLMFYAGDHFYNLSKLKPVKIFLYITKGKSGLILKIRVEFHSKAGKIQ